MNIGVQVYFWGPHFISFGHTHSGGIAESYDGSSFNFFEEPPLFSIMAILIYIPAKVWVPFSQHPCQHLLFFCLFDNLSNRCEVMYHWCWFAFPWWFLIVHTIYNVPVNHLHVLEKCLCRFFTHLFFMAVGKLRRGEWEGSVWYKDPCNCLGAADLQGKHK